MSRMHAVCPPAAGSSLKRTLPLTILLQDTITNNSRRFNDDDDDEGGGGEKRIRKSAERASVYQQYKRDLSRPYII